MIRPFKLATFAAAFALVALPATASAMLPREPAASAAKRTNIIINGSTSVRPLIQRLAAAYHKKVPSVTFNPKPGGGGSDAGINNAFRGRADIGTSSRDPEPGDPGLLWNKIARDGICIVTNPDNRLADVSQEMVQDIFSGRIRNWEDVQGASVTGPINLVVRTSGSGTQSAFQDIFMGQDLNVKPNVPPKTSNGLVQAAVSSDKQAIGYIDFHFAQGVNVASYKGVACTLRNAKSGQYPGLRNFWLVTRKKPSSALVKFIVWAQKDPTAQRKIVAKDWVAIH